MLAPIFQTFMDRLREAADCEALKDALSGVVDAFGLNGFAYASALELTPDPAPYLTTYPAHWVTRYLDERYHEIDPVVLKARRCTAPFHWDCQTPSPAASEDERRFLGDAEEFGIECGLTFPIHDGRRHPALLSFAYRRRQGPLSANIEKHLHLAALYFHVHAGPNWRRPAKGSAAPKPLACNGSRAASAAPTSLKSLTFLNTLSYAIYGTQNVSSARTPCHKLWPLRCAIG